jgi:hypothetical protein
MGRSPNQLDSYSKSVSTLAQLSVLLWSFRIQTLNSNLIGKDRLVIGMNELQITPSIVWEQWMSKAKSGEAKIVKYWAGGLRIAALDENLYPELWVEIPSLNENLGNSKTGAGKTAKGLITEV